MAIVTPLVVPIQLKIPSKFQLGGSTITVEKVKQITGEGLECDGTAFYCKSKIELKEDVSFSSDYKEWVFFHELIHFIFNVMGEKKLRINEKIVDQFAAFLHQAIKTME
jgi:hypothetical protein